MLEIVTKDLHLTYSNAEKGFNRSNLSIIQKNHNNRLWRLGDSSWNNLKGTTRTLDRINGETEIDPGLISRDGWAIVDDSNSLVYNENNYLENRKLNRKDLYFFGYGIEFKQCIKDFCKVSGKVSLLPRWALGNWWSRYWHYTQEELIELMNTFKERNVPISVCIVDMDWHVVDNQYSSGWTGYTWNKKFFPDHKEFIENIHDLGLKTALNLHPADGVQPHEEDYAKMAVAMGIDPSTNQPVYFDCSDPNFMKAYFEVLHHPKEEEGVDFWWIDWQQGSLSKVEGLDPLWMLNQAHYEDSKRDNKRGFIFSRWAGLGNHRYPIGFSGDSIVSWESLKFQPYFTATAANVGYSWWSHDIGGHYHGVEEEELNLRWIQFGIFSPIMRIHSSKNEFVDRRPWAYSKTICENIENAMRLRHQLIPYIYTMSYKNETEDQAFIYPMYHEYPKCQEAYNAKEQYFFGTELIVAPIVTKVIEDLRLSYNTTWLPEGEWYNFFTGEKHNGNSIIENYCKLNEIPVFAKSGAIVPMDKDLGWKEVANPENLLVKIFAGKDNSFELFEDDGITNNYLQGDYQSTIISQENSSENLKITISPTSNSYGKRNISLEVIGVNKDVVIDVEMNGSKINAEIVYDNTMEAYIISVMDKKDEDILIVNLSGNKVTEIRCRRKEKAYDLIKTMPLETSFKGDLGNKLDELISGSLKLDNFKSMLTPAQYKAFENII
jgi:alpha-glucosidase (family GH31 glycosyl hydrolase)